MENLRSEIAHAIGVMTTDTLPNVEYRILESTKENGYTRHLIMYDSHGCVISFENIGQK